MYLEEENGNDEVIKGEPLWEVTIVIAEEEQGKDENEVLSRQLRPSQTNDLQTCHRQNYGCTTTNKKSQRRAKLGYGLP